MWAAKRLLCYVTKVYEQKWYNILLFESLNHQTYEKFTTVRPHFFPIPASTPEH